MLIDMINVNNYGSYNRVMAQMFGLSAAVYCNELISIYQKAMSKNKMINGDYFLLDRNYVCKQTTLTNEEQLVIDEKWSKVGLLSKNVDNPNIIKLDIDMLVALMSGEDKESIEQITKKVKLKSKAAEKETKRSIAIKTLKDSIICTNYELLTALREWVDGIYANPNGYLSTTAIRAFQSTLNDYTKGDLDMALSIVKIATIQGYKDCGWAINVYEKDKRIKKSNEALLNSRLPRTTEQKRATKETLDNVVY